MRAFLVGLLFLLAVAVLAGIGILLFPLMILLAFILRLILGVLMVILAIWLLGKFIMFVWKNLGGTF